MLSNSSTFRDATIAKALTYADRSRNADPLAQQYEGWKQIEITPKTLSSNQESAEYPSVPIGVTPLD